jgi:hypothetical protein
VLIAPPLREGLPNGSPSVSLSWSRGLDVV